MNIKRYVLGSLAVFVFIFLAEFVFHGKLMAGPYNEHLELLRPQSEAESYMPYMSLGFLILAFGFSFIFVQGYQNRGVAEGLRFGLYVGIAFGVSSMLINYAVFPWPAGWIVAWAIGETVIVMLAGALLAVIYKPVGG